MGAFLMPETERRGAREKRIPDMPEGLQMRLGGTIGRRMFLYALCVPLYGDFGQCDGIAGEILKRDRKKQIEGEEK